jgi:hypothetical protein
MEKAHLKSGQDYLDVEYQAGIIYIRPVDVEERIPPEVFEKFQKAIRKRRVGDVELNIKEAEEFLTKRARGKNR